MSKTIASVKKFIARNARPAINVLRVASACLDGETVTIGNQVYELDTDPLPGIITAGRVRVDLSGVLGAAVQATGTGTTTGNFANAETVTINGTVYTFQTVLTNVAGNVFIGASASASLDNLIAAINGAAGAGVQYAAATVAHTTVTAAKGSASTITLTANKFGTVGNAYGTTETGAQFSFGAATLTGGVDPTAALTTTALTLAINGNPNSSVHAERISANEVLVTSKIFGAVVDACAETLGGANNVWGAAALYGGAGTPNHLPGIVQASRSPIAQEVTIGNMHFNFPFPPLNVTARVRVTATGVVKVWDGGITIVGNRVTLDNAGATDWATTDTVTVECNQ